MTYQKVERIVREWDSTPHSARGCPIVVTDFDGALVFQLGRSDSEEFEITGTCRVDCLPKGDKLAARVRIEAGDDRETVLKKCDSLVSMLTDWIDDNRPSLVEGAA